MDILNNVVKNREFQLAQQTDLSTRATTGFHSLPDVTITPGWDGEDGEAVTPAGNAFPTEMIDGYWWSTFQISMPLTFTTIIFFLVTLLHSSVSVSSGIATWIFKKKVKGADTLKCFTFEWGTPSAMWRAVGAHGMGFGITNDGSGNGRRFTANMRAYEIKPIAAFTAGATVIESVRVPKDQTNFQTADSWDELIALDDSDPVFDHYYGYELSMSNLLGGERPIKRGVGPWGDLYEMTPGATVTSSMLQSHDGTDFNLAPFTKANQEAGKPVFLRMDALGPVIPDSDPEVNYQMWIDQALLLGPGKPSEGNIDNNLITMSWPAQVAQDKNATGGPAAFQIKIVTDLATTA